MNRVLLVSLVGTGNFGNRLQQYALQRKVEELGFETDILIGRPLRVPPLLRKAIAEWPQKVKSTVCGSKKAISQWKRTNKFLKKKKLFYKNCLRVPAKKLRSTDWSRYSYVLAGSDQIWHGPSEFYYLQFVEASKRLSYAPSFGFDMFPEKDREAHRRGLMGMRALSCREQSGCELIRELTGREAQKTLDPTLLLTAEEWAEIESKPAFDVPERYLLQFFLGSVEPAYKAELTRIAEERGLPTLDIGNAEDPEHYAISPDEFLWLAHHADTLCTDSFHASVFAILFEKNLRVFRRRQEDFDGMFGRLHDLLAPLELLETVYGEGERISTALSGRAKAALAAEREASLRYLKESLKAE